jgi:hypothetical protein
MIRMNWKLNLVLLSTALILIVNTNAIAQFDATAPEKIWQTKQIDILQANFRDTNGSPSRDIFLKKNGLWPMDEKNHMTSYFTITFMQKDILEFDKKLKIVKNAKPIQIDFYLKNDKNHQALNKANPIWDGRIYEEDGRILVGGYSSRYNERPVGRFNDNGNFEKTIDKSLEAEFPILTIPAEQIIFDPFEWKIFNIEPTNGKAVEETSKSFLPISLLGANGQLVENVHYEIEHSGHHLILNATIGANKINIAQGDVTKTIADSREGYQPELQKGCAQPTDGKVVTFHFMAEFSESVTANSGSLFLKKSFVNSTVASQTPQPKMKIDGHFNEWRNIAGISDPEGDYVSYLYPNPDTDILEFKVSNDDTYLYFYSRIAGVHGRTGATGRYYWYTYIDIDANPNTGYPPTRDDNCYFGIAIGDDCEAQFEFIGNKFIKTFFGFTGLGSEQPAIDGKLTLGPSYYAPKDLQGNKREKYKIEYVSLDGSRSVTHDYTEGSSEDIIIALSADGSEVEMRVELAGFLWDKNGKQLVSKGQAINIAVGAEGDSGHYGSDKWGADSSPVIYGYKIK